MRRIVHISASILTLLVTASGMLLAQGTPNATQPKTGATSADAESSQWTLKRSTDEMTGKTTLMFLLLGTPKDGSSRHPFLFVKCEELSSVVVFGYMPGAVLVASDADSAWISFRVDNDGSPLEGFDSPLFGDFTMAIDRDLGSGPYAPGNPGAYDFETAVIHSHGLYVRTQTYPAVQVTDYFVTAGFDNKAFESGCYTPALLAKHATEFALRRAEVQKSVDALDRSLRTKK